MKALCGSQWVTAESDSLPKTSQLRYGEVYIVLDPHDEADKSRTLIWAIF